MAALVTKGEVWEDSGAVLMARVRTDDATYLQQADLSSIAYSVFDKADTTTATTTGALSVSQVVFDTLQTDARWGVDSTGYNFRWSAPASIFATGSKTYRIEIAFTPASGELFHVVFEVTVGALYRS